MVVVGIAQEVNSLAEDGWNKKMKRRQEAELRRICGEVEGCTATLVGTSKES